jgi:hypothetical protein
MATRFAAWMRKTQPLAGWVVLVALIALLSTQAIGWGQTPSEESSHSAPASSNLEYICWGICVAGSIAALVQAWFFYQSMMASDPGNERMQEIAGYV